MIAFTIGYRVEYLSPPPFTTLAIPKPRLSEASPPERTCPFTARSTANYMH